MESWNLKLLTAAKNGEIKVISYCLDQAADVNCVDITNGRTLLHWAAYIGQTETADILITHGATVNIKDKFGQTPLHLAAFWGKEETAGILISRGAILDIQDKCKYTPLHLAVVMGRTEISDMLMTHGAKANIKDNFGMTPLHRAAQRGFTVIVDLLINHGASVHIQDKRGRTPLDLAAYSDRKETAARLIDHGAIVGIKSKNVSLSLEKTTMCLEGRADESCFKKHHSSCQHEKSPQLSSIQIQQQSLTNLLNDLETQRDIELTPFIHTYGDVQQPDHVKKSFKAVLELTSKSQSIPNSIGSEGSKLRPHVSIEVQPKSIDHKELMMTERIIVQENETPAQKLARIGISNIQFGNRKYTEKIIPSDPLYFEHKDSINRTHQVFIEGEGTCIPIFDEENGLNTPQDCWNTSRNYDGYFVECIEHNQSRNRSGRNKGSSYVILLPNARDLVDCIVDKRLDAKRTTGAMSLSFEQLINERNIPEYTVLFCIKACITDKITISKSLSEKLILCAIKRDHSLLCRLMLSIHKRLNLSIQVYIHALELAMENSAKDHAKALAWFITRLFVRSHLHSLENIRDIWPAFVCNCKEKGGAVFCSKNVCIVIEASSENANLPHFTTVFNSIEIKILQHKYRDKTEAKFIAKRIQYITNISISKEMSISGKTAEILFKKHSKLTIINSSLCKSKGYNDKQNHEIVEGPCIQLYCRVKGLIPIGEEHFPRNICNFQTDVIEGYSSFMCSIRIGDMIGGNGKFGTLGGFLKVRGYPAFLTCCHVIADIESLDQGNISFDDETPVWISYFPWHQTQDGTCERNSGHICGSIREAPAFETDYSERVSLDAILVTIEGVTIEKDNLLATNDNTKISFADLGMRTEYLNENCIDYNQFIYGNPIPQVKVFSNGAMSGLFRSNVEIIKDVKGTSVDLQSFKDSFAEVYRECKHYFISLVQEIFTMTDSQDDIAIDTGRWIENKCDMDMSLETKLEIIDVITQVVNHLKANRNLANYNDTGNLLDDAVRNKAATNNVNIFPGTHMQNFFLAKTSEMRDERRLSRRMYNQICISGIPFKSGDSGTCIYLNEPNISGCVGMAIADHPGGGCIATPIMEILKHFKIRIKTS